MPDTPTNSGQETNDSFQLGGFLKKNETAKGPGTQEQTAESGGEMADNGGEAGGNGGEAGKQFFFEGDATEAGFIFILKATFKTFFKKFWVFLGVSILNILLVGGVMLAMMPLMFMLMMSGNSTALMVIPIIIPILLGLISFFFYGTIANQAHSAYNDLGIKVLASFRQGVRLTGRAIALVFRIFIFSGMWMFFVLMLISAVVYAVLGGLGPSLMGNIAGAVKDNLNIENLNFNMPEINFGFNGVLLAQGGLIDPVATSRIAVAEGGGVNSGQMFFVVASFILAAAGLAITVLALIRMVYASMAFPILFASPEHSSKEVLHRSREITRKKWWLIVCFMTVFPLITGFPAAITQLLGAFVFAVDANFALASNIVAAITLLFAYPLTVIFYQILAQELANPEHRVKLHGGILAVTLLIFLSPLIAAAVSYAVIGGMIQGNSSLLEGYIKSYKPPQFEESDFSLTDAAKLLEEEEGGAVFGTDDESDPVPAKPKVKRN